MDLSKEKPSKNVKQDSEYNQALAEYWWRATNARRSLADKPHLDPELPYVPKKNDPVLKDPKLDEHVKRMIKRRAWFRDLENMK